MMANLRWLRQADRELDSCGRPVAPAGYKFVDLPYVIPVKATFVPPDSPGTPFQIRVKNNSLAPFDCKGVVIAANYPVRIKWPNGRYLSKGATAVTPAGTGSSMFALHKPVRIDSGAVVAVEVTA